MQRTRCCLCPKDAQVLQPVFVMEDLPTTFSPTSQPFEQDCYVDVTFGACLRCGSVQLMNLVEQTVLYGSSHNQTCHSRIWREHHESLAEFVRAAHLSSAARVIEVGGASGDLANHLLGTTFHEYTILELSIPAQKTCDARFVEGNCENFTFSSGSVLILSHVFEHLYNPADFADNCALNGVTDVFLSVPDMAVLDAVPIHIEHTFYVELKDIIGLFSRSSYTLKRSRSFRAHSQFVHFSYDSETVPMQPEYDGARQDRVIRTLMERKQKFESLKIPAGSFVSPAGPYGQMLQFYAKSTVIRGFLDNDVSKQCKRVYGTPYEVFPFSAVSGSGPVVIILHAGPYSNELSEQIRSINNEAEIILI
jgi:hypothetical protein